MSRRRTLRDVFRSWAFKPRNIGRRSSDSTILMLESFEERVTPATLPQPTVITPTANTASIAVPAGYNPQVVADPTNPLHQVMVFETGTGVGARTSPDGGTTWNVVLGFGTLPTDPNTSPAVAYTTGSSPSVAFGRDGTLYFVYLGTNGTATKTSGAVMFQKASFGTGNLVAAAGTKTLYQWVGTDPALNPTIGVDNNVRTDTVAGTTDTLIQPNNKSKGVYVAWNGNAAPTGGFDTNANPIMGVMSGDDGATWSNPSPVSDNGFAGATNGAAPQIFFSPANSGRPGSLIYVWPTLAGTIMYDSTQPDGGVAGNTVAQAYSTGFIGGTGAIQDATVPPASPPPPPNTPDQATPLVRTLTVPAGLIPNTTPAFSLNDLSIELKMRTPHLDHMSVVLSVGANSVTLLSNRIDGLNATLLLPNGTPRGLPATAAPSSGLGVLYNAPATSVFGTVFSNTGARSITDANNATTNGYIGTFRPENGTNILTSLGLNGASAFTLNGLVFTLTISGIL